ncbi:MAG TPA: DUF423 domain-containing protein [Rudaea sp.]|jgi:uncharacterized membrane protein YgdD (TMEM256/DUF423 family)|nr:DUF423 domain-containing protein [Rudaea sp.]
MIRSPAITAAALGAVAVILGAFGAHALRGQLDAASLQVWHTAVEYQFWHALALLGLAAAPVSRWRTAGSIAFGMGIVLFCGSLYALALGAPRWTGAITPVGGLAFIAGWICLGGAFWRSAR